MYGHNYRESEILNSVLKMQACVSRSHLLDQPVTTTTTKMDVQAGHPSLSQKHRDNHDESGWKVDTYKVKLEIGSNGQLLLQ